RGGGLGGGELAAGDGGDVAGGQRFGVDEVVVPGGLDAVGDEEGGEACLVERDGVADEVGAVGEGGERLGPLGHVGDEVVGVGAGPVVALGVPLVEAADLEGFGVGVLEGDGEQPAVFFFAVLVAEDEPHLPD